MGWLPTCSPAVRWTPRDLELVAFCSFAKRAQPLLIIAQLTRSALGRSFPLLSDPKATCDAST
jgi:hypothetical protein